MKHHKARAAVIGSGFGGLGAAIRLQAKGYDTTIYEMRDKPGGRAYVYEDKGFVYDAGPTIITAPFLIDELFELAGKKTDDYIRIVPCSPFYRIIFHDGTSFEYTGSEEAMLEQVRGISPEDAENYPAFVAKTKEIFERAFMDLADQPFSSVWDMVKVAPDLLRLRSDRSVYRMACKYMKHPKLRMVFSFHPLLVGGHPFHSSSIYSMIYFLERKWGVHFAMGGTGALVSALLKLFEEMGGRIRLNAKVEEILIADAKVRGLRLVGGEEIPVGLVVSNGDVANIYRQCVNPIWRKKWSDRRLSKMKYSMGLFLIYFGTNRTYPDIAHHSIVLSRRYKELLDDIFQRKVLAEDFSLYLHAPTRTDPGLAPEGHECFYVLSPVPHTDGNIDWEKEKERYADAILESLEKVCPDLRKHIVSRLIMTPADFERDLDAYKGSAFQFEPILTQSAWFRPHNAAEGIEGLYLVGAGTHPGAGVPGVLSSAKALERLIGPATLQQA